jgi:hypothetical protein
VALGKQSEARRQQWSGVAVDRVAHRLAAAGRLAGVARISTDAAALMCVALRQHLVQVWAGARRKAELRVDARKHETDIVVTRDPAQIVQRIAVEEARDADRRRREAGEARIAAAKTALAESLATGTSQRAVRSVETGADEKMGGQRSRPAGGGQRSSPAGGDEPPGSIDFGGSRKRRKKIAPPLPPLPPLPPPSTSSVRVPMPFDLIVAYKSDAITPNPSEGGGGGGSNGGDAPGNGNGVGGGGGGGGRKKAPSAATVAATVARLPERHRRVLEDERARETARLRNETVNAVLGIVPISFAALGQRSSLPGAASKSTAKDSVRLGGGGDTGGDTGSNSNDSSGVGGNWSAHLLSQSPSLSSAFLVRGGGGGRHSIPTGGGGSGSGGGSGGDATDATLLLKPHTVYQWAQDTEDESSDTDAPGHAAEGDRHPWGQLVEFPREESDPEPDSDDERGPYGKARGAWVSRTGDDNDDERGDEEIRGENGSDGTGGVEENGGVTCAAHENKEEAALSSSSAQAAATPVSRERVGGNDEFAADTDRPNRKRLVAWGTFERRDTAEVAVHSKNTHVTVLDVVRHLDGDTVFRRHLERDPMLRRSTRLEAVRHRVAMTPVDAPR